MMGTPPRSSILDTTRVSQSHRYGCVGQDTMSEEVKLYWMKTSVVSAKLGVEIKQQEQTTL